MIVWGGLRGRTYANTGGVYDPATDTWTATHHDGRALARALPHGGVDRDEDDRLGGIRRSGLFEHRRASTTRRPTPGRRRRRRSARRALRPHGGVDGHEDDRLGRQSARQRPSQHRRASTIPRRDTLDGDVTTGAPTGRVPHTAVWTGSKMIVWGGRTPAPTPNTGGRYDPATDTWTATTHDGSAHAPATRHTAVWTGTEMIVWGGRRGLTTRGSLRPALLPPHRFYRGLRCFD